MSTVLILRTVLISLYVFSKITKSKYDKWESRSQEEIMTSSDLFSESLTLHHSL